MTPKARPIALPLMTVALFLAAPFAQGQVPATPSPHDTTCHQATALDEDVILDCTLLMAEAMGNAADMDPTASGWCYPPGYTPWVIYGASEDKWTPLYGTNSPRYGSSTLDLGIKESATVKMGFEWQGTGTRLSTEGTLWDGVSLEANDGESKVVYQLMTWTEFTRRECGSDWHWHTYHGYEVTDYNPTTDPTPPQRIGHLEGASFDTDTDNYLWPEAASWATNETLIKIDLRYSNKDGDQCLEGQGKKFGSNAVWSVGVAMGFDGFMEVGWGKIKTQESSFEYWFDHGCYYMDRLGGKEGKSGLAFHMWDDDSNSGGTPRECSGKGLLEEPMSCPQEPCTEGMPTMEVVQDAYCEALPGCDDMAGVPIACSGVPPECGDGTEPGESCLPGRPGSPGCPPDAVALPGGSCDPCDAVKTPLLECGLWPPTCEDVPVAPCPPVQRPCSDYAPGIGGEIARWVCEDDAPDPCDMEWLDPAAPLLCGITNPPPEE